MTQTNDRILPGIVLMLAFCALAPLLDVSSKLATETLPVGQITTARFVVQAALMLPVVLWMRLPLRVSPRMAGRVLLRALFLILSTYSFVAAVSFMAIADALAIAFVEPFVLLILGHFLFGDQVGPRRIAACAVGFLGAMLVIQPSLAAFGLRALWPLGTAFCFAFYMLSTRAISASLHPVTMQFHTAVAGMVVMLPIMVAMDGSGTSFDPAMPQGIAWLWLFGMGFWATVSHMCMTYALKFAPTTVLAPLHYSEIVVSVTLGYLVFGDFPNLIAWAGIALIVASGLYIIYRERMSARAGAVAAEDIAAPTH
ncbi:MAG: DMT family transporter [Paracoccaceae bacterium]